MIATACGSFRRFSRCRIIERLLALVVVLASAAIPAMAAGTVDPASSQTTLKQGLDAYRSGRIAQAIPALEQAATSREPFLAQFYLARIYADNSHPLTDHGKAYILYQRIADAFADIDPDDDQRAPFVAKALVALAAYLKNGVPDIGLKPDSERAAQYLHHAATFFADEDAQFELAKLFLTGDGMPADQRRAVHWFSVLTQRGHPGAQAFLADLIWRGRYVQQNTERALALATLAVEGAPANERIWIEDIYQRIYCGSSEGQRTDAGGVVADWRQKYGRAPEPERGLTLWPAPVRTCDDGRVVHIPSGKRAPGEALKAIVPVDPPGSKTDLTTAATVPGSNGKLMDIGTPAPGSSVRLNDASMTGQPRTP